MFCSKHVDVKRHSVCFPEIEKNICRIFFRFEFIRFSNRRVLSAAPCITHTTKFLSAMKTSQLGWRTRRVTKHSKFLHMWPHLRLPVTSQRYTCNGCLYTSNTSDPRWRDMLPSDQRMNRALLSLQGIPCLSNASRHRIVFSTFSFSLTDYNSKTDNKVVLFQCSIQVYNKYKHQVISKLHTVNSFFPP